MTWAFLLNDCKTLLKVTVKFCFFQIKIMNMTKIRGHSVVVAFLVLENQQQVIQVRNETFTED